MHMLVVPLLAFGRSSDLMCKTRMIPFAVVVKMRSNDVEPWIECLMKGGGEAATPLTGYSCFCPNIDPMTRQLRTLRPGRVK